MSKKILYLDMDNVLVDFPSAFDRLDQEILEAYKGRLDEVPGIFSLMDPLDGAENAFRILVSHFEVYILSTAPWGNPSAWTDKLLWVKKYFPEIAYKRLILSHNKHLNAGDYLVDDRLKNGVDKFTGEHIHFGTDAFPDWPSVLSYLGKKEGFGGE